MSRKQKLLLGGVGVIVLFIVIYSMIKYVVYGLLILGVFLALGYFARKVIKRLWSAIS